MPTPEELMDKGKVLLKSKAADYTSGTNRYENFERQRILISWFKLDIDRVFISVIAIKLSRLASLLGHKEPKHESIEDTFIDLINYSALWAACRTSEVVVGKTTFTNVPESDRLACEIIDKTKFLYSLEIDKQSRDYLIGLVESRYRENNKRHPSPQDNVHF